MPLARHPRKGQEGDPLYIYLAKMREISWMCVPNCNDMWYRVSPSPLPASMKPRAPTSNGAVPPKHLCMPVNNWDPSCPGSIASVMVACCSKACTLFPEVDAYSPLKRWLSWVKKTSGVTEELVCWLWCDVFKRVLCYACARSFSKPQAQKNWPAGADGSQ